MVSTLNTYNVETFPKTFDTPEEASAHVNELLEIINSIFDDITEIADKNPKIAVHWTSPADHSHEYASADFEEMPEPGPEAPPKEWDYYYGNVRSVEYPGQWFISRAILNSTQNKLQLKNVNSFLVKLTNFLNPSRILPTKM
jgi:hypothetical protein